MMNIDSWFQVIEQALKAKGIKLTPEIKNHLLSELPETSTYQQEKITTEVLEAVYEFFYHKATHGETFGELSRIKEKFGETVEENFGLAEGPFMNMAKTYWTFKLEVQDLLPVHHKILLSIILNRAEMTIAGIFFPTPGPTKIPVKQRKEMQREQLHSYAPEIDAERFLNEHPLLQKKEFSSKRDSYITDSLLGFNYPIEGIKDYCWRKIFEYAQVYESVLSSRLNYQMAFEKVMEAFSISRIESSIIWAGSMKAASYSTIPYHNFTPLNQFMITLYPYICFCFSNDPPPYLEKIQLEELLENYEFRILVDNLGKEISQKIKGALWRPNVLLYGSLIVIVIIIFLFIIL